MSHFEDVEAIRLRAAREADVARLAAASERTAAADLARRSANAAVEFLDKVRALGGNLATFHFMSRARPQEIRRARTFFGGVRTEWVATGYQDDTFIDRTPQPDCLVRASYIGYAFSRRVDSEITDYYYVLDDGAVWENHFFSSNIPDVGCSSRYRRLDGAMPLEELLALLKTELDRLARAGA